MCLKLRHSLLRLVHKRFGLEQRRTMIHNIKVSIINGKRNYQNGLADTVTDVNPIGNMWAVMKQNRRNVCFYCKRHFFRSVIPSITLQISSNRNNFCLFFFLIFVVHILQYLKNLNARYKKFNTKNNAKTFPTFRSVVHNAIPLSLRF